MVFPAFSEVLLANYFHLFLMWLLKLGSFKVILNVMLNDSIAGGHC